MAIDASSIITHQLEPGERLIWSGQPRGGFLLRPSDAFLIPFSLMWGGFAIFWEYGVLTMPNPKTAGTRPLFALFGIPFVLTGLYVMVGRFFVDALQRESTFYGLTNRRVIIVSGISYRFRNSSNSILAALSAQLFGTKVRTLELGSASPISMTEKSDGSGSITFGLEDPRGVWAGSGWPGFGQRTGTTFDSIEHVASVYDKVREALRS